jgi:hypothetical protein
VIPITMATAQALVAASGRAPAALPMDAVAAD